MWLIRDVILVEFYLGIKKDHVINIQLIYILLG